MFSSLFGSSSKTTPVKQDSRHNSFLNPDDLSNLHLTKIYVGDQVFYTQDETIHRFAPHRMSDDLGVLRTMYPYTHNAILFVDQTPEIFPRILEYLRAAHETPSFLSEMNETEIWQLYEQNRDFYKIIPLDRVLNKYLYGTEEELKGESESVSRLNTFINAVVSVFDTLDPTGAVKKLGEKLKTEMFQDKAIHILDDRSRFPGTAIHNEDGFLDLEACRTKHVRYDRKTEIWLSCLRIVSYFGSFFPDFFSAVSGKSKSEDRELKNKIADLEKVAISLQKKSILAQYRKRISDITPPIISQDQLEQLTSQELLEKCNQHLQEHGLELLDPVAVFGHSNNTDVKTDHESKDAKKN